MQNPKRNINLIDSLKKMEIVIYGNNCCHLRITLSITKKRRKFYQIENDFETVIFLKKIKYIKTIIVLSIVFYFCLFTDFKGNQTNV